MSHYCDRHSLALTFDISATARFPAFVLAAHVRRSEELSAEAPSMPMMEMHGQQLGVVSGEAQSARAHTVGALARGRSDGARVAVAFAGCGWTGGAATRWRDLAPAPIDFAALRAAISKSSARLAPVADAIW